MKSVIHIPENNTENNEPVEFTKILSGFEGFKDTSIKPVDYNKIIYLGRCNVDGDMFVAYSSSGNIIIFKGYLNSGKY